MPDDGAHQTTVTPLGTWPLDAESEKEVRLFSVDYPPGVHSAPHRHPGSQVVHVLSGSIHNHMDGEVAREYRAGESWYERPGQLHIDIGNDSETAARILVINISDANDPILVQDL